MKYTYAYKTSDGQRHEDSMEAECREEVFSALRAQGIKAIKVVAADGSKANGEVPRAAWFLPRAVIVGIGCLILGLVIAILVVRQFFRPDPVLLVPGEHETSGVRTAAMTNITHAIKLDPETAREFQRLEEEKRRAELDYRDRLAERVKKGTLSRKTANEIFRAMSLPEL